MSVKTLGPKTTLIRQRTERPMPRKERALATNSKAWRAIRQRILIRDLYLCQSCGMYGNEVDHVDGDTGHNDEANLQTLCKPCHSIKTATENKGFGNP